MWRYRFLLIILVLPIVLHTIKQALLFRDFRLLKQRLGFHFYHPQKHSIWIHAASVGELNAAMPLIQLLQQQYPHDNFIVTTNTATSASIAKQKLSGAIQHYYLPIDWRWPVFLFLRQHQPKCLVVMETELWPHLYTACFKKQIPIVIINGRLSHRTIEAKRWLRDIYRLLLRNVTQILARSEQDKNRFLALGARTEHIRTIGNIKYAQTRQQQPNTTSIVQRPFVLAASTHDNEEQRLITIWKRLCCENIINDEILVIVPRHPQRSAAILKQLDLQQATISVRSDAQAITAQTQIYLADTVGELAQFMQQAKFIFMGGSLIPHGGQNIIEPAQLGKAIIFGPYMDNFIEESQLLLNNHAAVQIDNDLQLYEIFKSFLNDSQTVEKTGASAKAVMQNMQNMPQLYLIELQKIIDKLP